MVIEIFSKLLLILLDLLTSVAYMRKSLKPTRSLPNTFPYIYTKLTSQNCILVETFLLRYIFIVFYVIDIFYQLKGFLLARTNSVVRKLVYQYILFELSHEG